MNQPKIIGTESIRISRAPKEDQVKRHRERLITNTFWPPLYVLICVLVSSMPKVGAQCVGGNLTFVKTSGSRLDPQQAQLQVLKSQTGQVVLPDCIELCKMNMDCHVFNMDYSMYTCTSIATNEARQEFVTIIPTSSVFEKICLDDVTDYENFCKNRMWAFERVIGLSMVGYRHRTETNVLNRSVCGKLCLLENNFTCRSAQYDISTRNCILSREDRRTQPAAFVPTNNRDLDYLENQCAPPAPIASCTYETKEDVTAMSTEDIRQSFDELECQSNCDHPVFFSCRSYIYIPNQRKCYLSADDSISLPENVVANRSDSLKSFYGERKCSGNQCTDGIIAFIKVTGHELRSAAQEPLMSGAMGNTAECLARCKDEGNKCPSLIINYATDSCSKLDRNSQYRDNDLVPAPNGGVNFFDTVCLRGNTHTCSNKLWAFERVPNHELRGFDEYVLPNVLSLRDCMEACVLETMFPCRSAEYDYDRVHCTLSTETRRSQWTYFVSTAKNVDYLENQCVEDSDFLCKYVQQGSALPRYVDLVLPMISSNEACQNACNSQTSFECHSIGYRSTSMECMMSGDDHISGGNVAMVPSSGISYYEKVCRPSSEINNDSTSTQSDKETSATTEEGSTESPLPIGSSESASGASPVTEPFPVTLSTEESAPDPSIVPQTQGPTSMTTLRPPIFRTGRCPDNRGRIEFEKTTGHKIAGDLVLLHDGGNIMGISYECTVKCNADETCQGFVIDYVDNKCYSTVTENPPSNIDFLEKALSTSYYEPVCYQSATGCGKLWTFERFPQNQLNVVASSSLRGITKSECEERCLMERGFLCRSANYDANNLICHLNADDRFTRSTSLIGSTSYDYLENQCYQTTYISPGLIFLNRDNSPRIVQEFLPPTYGVDPRSSKGGGRGRIDPRGSCYFVNDAPNSLLTYVEKEKIVGNEVDCQRSCDDEIQFNCHSYTYFILASSGYGNGHCYLSADTRNSLGAELKVQAGASYVERICTENMLPTSPNRPPPPQWPPYNPQHPPPPPPPPPYPYPTYLPYPNNYPVYSGQPPPPPFRPNPNQAFPAPYPAPYQQPFLGYVNTEVQNQFPSAKEPLNYLGNDVGQVFPLPGFTSKGTGAGGTIVAKCLSNADVTFERVTHLASQGTGSEVRISLLLSPTLDCLRECVAFDDQCQSVTFRMSFNGYEAPCSIYELPSGGTMTPPITSSSAAYFQKICIPGQKCNKAWAIDRVPYHMLEGHDDLELRNINSRDECVTACLQQTAFTCRSAEYYFSQSICRLSQETRRTQPMDYRFYGDGVEYLENNCNPEPGLCEFKDFPEKFLPYFDRRLLGVPNLYECKLSCSQENGFTCHSVAYDEQTKECYLSSCDNFCGYQIVERRHTIYSERQACDNPTSVRLLSQQPVNHRLLQVSSSLAVTSKFNTASICERSQQISFERTTGYAPFSVYQELIHISRVRGITEECITECSSMGSRCQAFVLLYLPPPTQPKCVVYTQPVNAETPTDATERKPEVAYFEKICFTDQPCNKLWAFERLFGYEMVAGFGSSLEAVESRRDCENLCLKNTNFPCRSAVYSRQIRTCRLHVDSRHTSPAGFLFVGGDVQYLENQCVI